MTGIMSIAQIRGQLQMADMLAKSGIDFVVVPITTEEERIALAEQALNKIEELQADRSNKNEQ